MELDSELRKEFERRYEIEKLYLEFIQEKEEQETERSRMSICNLLQRAKDSTDPKSPFVDYSGNIHPDSKIGKELSDLK